MTYSPQVEPPLGDHINHLSGVAVDATDNVYVLDHRFGQGVEAVGGIEPADEVGFQGHRHSV